jgi:hypothetical protein
MRSEMDDLVDVLKSNPGEVLISDDGTAAYLLVGPQQSLMVITSLKKNFNDMTQAEFNEFIQNLLK